MAQTDKHDRAAAELERAAAAFGSFGSHRHRAEAERELRKLGRPVHRRTAAGRADVTGVDSLTERESHLRNMFGKLEVSSRVEVARVVERADPAERAPA